MRVLKHTNPNVCQHDPLFVQRSLLTVRLSPWPMLPRSSKENSTQCNVKKGQRFKAPYTARCIPAAANPTRAGGFPSMLFGCPHLPGLHRCKSSFLVDISARMSI
jgi:hypothetical protein